MAPTDDEITAVLCLKEEHERILKEQSSWITAAQEAADRTLLLPEVDRHVQQKPLRGVGPADLAHETGMEGRLGRSELVFGGSTLVRAVAATNVGRLHAGRRGGTARLTGAYRTFIPRVSRPDKLRGARVGRRPESGVEGTLATAIMRSASIICRDDRSAAAPVAGDPGARPTLR